MCWACDGNLAGHVCWGRAAVVLGRAEALVVPGRTEALRSKLRVGGRYVGTFSRARASEQESGTRNQH